MVQMFRLVYCLVCRPTPSPLFVNVFWKRLGLTRDGAPEMSIIIIIQQLIRATQVSNQTSQIYVKTYISINWGGGGVKMLQLAHHLLSMRRTFRYTRESSGYTMSALPLCEGNTACKVG